VRYDAIIIGAGMSGLAAALRLSLFDRRVLVLERHELWGGLNSFYTKDGHAFDVGLHALTNYAPPRTRGAPLTHILRQLRIRHDELRLGEQHRSELRVPGVALAFTNDFEVLREEVGRAFPSQRDGFDRLVREVREFTVDEVDRPEESGRAVLERHLTEPLLVDALLVPLLYYGSAREDDVDWSQLVVLFRSIFLEGLARPEGGIRTLLNLVIKRLKGSSVELRLSTGVERILVRDGRCVGVELEGGETAEADQVLSSAGYVETMRLAGQGEARRGDREVGRLSFLECLSVVDTDPAGLGLDAATVFYSTRSSFRYRRPEDLVDTTSGVLSVPSNFASERPLKEPLVRCTVLANHDLWCALPEEDYRRAKEEHSDAAVREAATILPDWSDHTVYRDVFTPRTIRHYTGHEGGAVYGSPRKRKTGATGIDGLALIGTDQGYLGVVGAMMSGIAMANRHALPRASAVPGVEVAP
jgi:phytoene dehydrogenase-like protein